MSIKTEILRVNRGYYMKHLDQHLRYVDSVVPDKYLHWLAYNFYHMNKRLFANKIFDNSKPDSDKALYFDGGTEYEIRVEHVKEFLFTLGDDLDHRGGDYVYVGFKKLLKKIFRDAPEYSRIRHSPITVDVKYDYERGVFVEIYRMWVLIEEVS